MDAEQFALFDMAHEPRPDREGPARKKWAGSVVTAARKIVGAMLPAPCWRCGTMLTKESKWTVGHLEARADDGGDTASNYAPECGKCNFSEGGKRGAAITNSRKVEAIDIERVRRIKWW